MSQVEFCWEHGRVRSSFAGNSVESGRVLLGTVLSHVEFCWSTKLVHIAVHVLCRLRPWPDSFQRVGKNSSYSHDRVWSSTAFAWFLLNRKQPHDMPKGHTPAVTILGFCIQNCCPGCDALLGHQWPALQCLSNAGNILDLVFFTSNLPIR